MTEKRYTYSELNNCQYSVNYTRFEEIYGEENVFHSRICEVNNKKQAQKVCDLLNEQEELIKRLKTIREEQTETILKQKRKMQELETRNKRQYNRLKELTELMYEKQWEKLENMVNEWEKQEELLRVEWGTYCENE